MAIEFVDLPIKNGGSFHKSSIYSRIFYYKPSIFAVPPSIIWWDFPLETIQLLEKLCIQTIPKLSETLPTGSSLYVPRNVSENMKLVG